MKSIWVAATAVMVGAPITSVAADAEPVEPAGLQEITVTAQRREENAQSVPISIKAVNASQLQAAGVSGSDTLFIAAPGFQVGRSVRNIQFYIRGIGSSAPAGSEPAVGTFIDGLYSPFTIANFFSFDNIEQIEILKGPQGTLFGRNTTGGVVNISTRDPTAQPQAQFSLDYSNFNTKEAHAYVSGGLSDRIASDLSFFIIKQGDGFGRNLVTGEDISKRDEWAFRTKTIFDITDIDRLVFTADYDQNKSTNGFASNLLPGYVALGGATFKGTIYDSQQNPTAVIPYAAAWSASLKYTRSMDWAKFSLLSGYRFVHSNFTQDADYTPISYLYVAAQRERDNMYQNEALLEGTSGPLEWTVGAIELHLAGAYTPLAVASGKTPAANYVEDAEVVTNSVAGFAQGTYAITSSTKFTLGGRYTVDHAALDGYQVAAAGNAKPAGTYLVAPTEQSGHWNKPTWRVALDQTLTDNMMGYVSYNRGFKSGNYSILALTSAPFKPETLDAYEAGIKSELLDHTLRVNVAGFYYNYKNQQIKQILAAGVSQLYNPPTSHLYGSDLDVEYAPRLPAGNNLNLTAGLSLLHATYTNFPGGPVGVFNPGGGVTTVAGDLSGLTLPQAPKWTLNLGADYSVNVGAGRVGLSADYYHNAGFFFSFDDKLAQSAYNIVNGRLYYAFGPDDKYRVRLWAKNLTNTGYYAYQSEQAYGNYGLPGIPRTYGVGVDVKLF